MRASSPACSVHAMDSDALTEEGARIFVLCVGERPAAMVALKQVEPGHGELKSMHVAQDVRGQGHARLMLAHILAMAREESMLRLSLETGSQDVFKPARALYRSEGFEDCPPFGSYRPDPNSVFLTRAL